MIYINFFKNFVLILFLISVINMSKTFSSVDFKMDKIDYWKQNKKKEKKEEEKQEKAKKKVKSKYLNSKPTNENFWREGNHIPPFLFRKMADRPTDENIKLWFNYVELKNKLSKRLSENMKRYLVKNNIDSRTQQILKNNLKKIKTYSGDNRRYRFQFYFRTTCPHCKRMYKTMNQLVLNGFYVEGKKTDKDGRIKAKLNFPVFVAEKSELEKLKITSVPYLVIADTKKKILITKITGFRDINSIMEIIKKNEKK